MLNVLGKYKFKIIRYGVPPILLVGGIIFFMEMMNESIRQYAGYELSNLPIYEIKLKAALSSIPMAAGTFTNVYNLVKIVDNKLRR